MKGKIYYIYFAFLLFSVCIQIYSKDNIVIIKEPTFSHEDTLIPVQELKVFKQGDLNFSNAFVASIGDMTVSPNGNVFVYDSKQVKLFKLNQGLQLITTFSNSGQGPGELLQMGNFKSVYLNAGWDNKLYLYNHPNNVVYVYTESGKYMSTIKPVTEEFTIGKPTANSDGSLAMICKEGKLAIYTPKEGKYDQKIIELDPSLCSKYLFMAPKADVVNNILRDSNYVTYGYLADGKLALWFSNCGELRLFDKHLKLVATHSIRPKKVLLNFKNKLLANIKKSGDRYEGYVPFGKMIGSVGNPEEYLILSFVLPKENKGKDNQELEYYSYVFDKNLKIMKIYKMPAEALALTSYKDKKHFCSTDKSRTSLLLSL